MMVEPILFDNGSNLSLWQWLKLVFVTMWALVKMLYILEFLRHIVPQSVGLWRYCQLFEPTFVTMWALVKELYVCVRAFKTHSPSVCQFMAPVPTNLCDDAMAQSNFCDDGSNQILWQWLKPTFVIMAQTNLCDNGFSQRWTWILCAHLLFIENPGSAWTLWKPDGRFEQILRHRMDF